MAYDPVHVADMLMDENTYNSTECGIRSSWIYAKSESTIMFLDDYENSWCIRFWRQIRQRARSRPRIFPSSISWTCHKSETHPERDTSPLKLIWAHNLFLASQLITFWETLPSLISCKSNTYVKSQAWICFWAPCEEVLQVTHLYIIMTYVLESPIIKHAIMILEQFASHFLFQVTCWCAPCGFHI